MKLFTKKRIVLFLLFIFPLICFLILSTGENNFTKLPVVTENVLDIADVNNEVDAEFINHITVLTFLGNDPAALEAGLLNLNEKVYKKFIDYKQFQFISVYPEGKSQEVTTIKEKLAAFTDLKQWKFVSLKEDAIHLLYQGLGTPSELTNLSSTKAFLIDKTLNLRGRNTDEDATDGMLFGYNLNSISELNGKMKDDISVLFYEYYAAFKVKNKNKAQRKEVGL